MDSLKKSSMALLSAKPTAKERAEFWRTSPCQALAILSRAEERCIAVVASDTFSTCQAAVAAVMRKIKITNAKPKLSLCDIFKLFMNVSVVILVLLSKCNRTSLINYSLITLVD